MIFRHAQLSAWVGRKADPVAAAIVLASGLKSDIAALKTRLMETRAAIAALREAWSRTRPPARSRRGRSSVRIVGSYRRVSSHHKEVELT
jgi:hypothetical protein